VLSGYLAIRAETASLTITVGGVPGLRQAITTPGDTNCTHNAEYERPDHCRDGQHRDDQWNDSGVDGQATELPIGEVLRHVA
jgi:hypothetical protein